MASNYLIVVGVDGSDGGRRALDWAVHEAANRGGVVRAVAAWRWDGIESDFVVVSTAAEEKSRMTEILERAVGEVTRATRAPVPAAGEVVEGRAADVLTTAARDADLLVLGSHGHSRIRHTVLGSVSEECVRKAACPVVVIPVPAPAPTAEAVTEPAPSTEAGTEPAPSMEAWTEPAPSMEAGTEPALTARAGRSTRR